MGIVHGKTLNVVACYQFDQPRRMAYVIKLPSLFFENGVSNFDNLQEDSFQFQILVVLEVIS